MGHPKKHSNKRSFTVESFPVVSISVGDPKDNLDRLGNALDMAIADLDRQKEIDTTSRPTLNGNDDN